MLRTVIVFQFFFGIVRILGVKAVREMMTIIWLKRVGNSSTPMYIVFLLLLLILPSLIILCNYVKWILFRYANKTDEAFSFTCERIMIYEHDVLLSIKYVKFTVIIYDMILSILVILSVVSFSKINCWSPKMQ